MKHTLSVMENKNMVTRQNKWVWW